MIVQERKDAYDAGRRAKDAYDAGRRAKGAKRAADAKAGKASAVAKVKAIKANRDAFEQRAKDAVAAGDATAIGKKAAIAAQAAASYVALKSAAASGDVNARAILAKNKARNVVQCSRRYRKLLADAAAGDASAIAKLADKRANQTALYQDVSRSRDAEMLTALTLSTGRVPAAVLTVAELNAATHGAVSLVLGTLATHPHAVVGVQLTRASGAFAEAVSLGKRAYVGAYMPPRAFTTDAVVVVVFATDEPHHAAKVEAHLHARLLDRIPSGQRLFNVVGMGGPRYPFPGVPYLVTVTVFPLGWPASATLVLTSKRAPAVAAAIARRTAAQDGLAVAADALGRARAALMAAASSAGFTCRTDDGPKAATSGAELAQQLRSVIGRLGVPCLRALVGLYERQRASSTVLGMLREALTRAQAGSGIKAFFAPAQLLGGPTLAADLMAEEATQAAEDEAGCWAVDQPSDDEDNVSDSDSADGDSADGDSVVGDWEAASDSGDFKDVDGDDDDFAAPRGDGGASVSVA